ncbi:MAG: zinc ribbon domain-containing protein [bacterium]|uniref:FmdB family transcriptional regulator n=1 Tax=candidate division WOR-3 bacterium TaxID=2052148 RepID=A0A348ML77_UNCW3|nr:zinc ribbon domain-containing protein [bacterium]HAF07803.1 FmdB family transcriptional regulator [candidate division WOR-3 bacterium]HCP17321.1 FmdB family transcriptional regulator [candidate division WOR-3 bacterium]
MPNYDYKCKKCGLVFNVFHKMSDTPKVRCPECNSLSEKILSYNSNIIFKGSGFYVNDYKNNGNSHSHNKKENDKGKSNCSGGNCSGSCSSCS